MNIPDELLGAAWVITFAVSLYFWLSLKYRWLPQYREDIKAEAAIATWDFIIKKLQDDKDEDLPVLFRDLATRMFVGVTQNPELKQKVKGYIHATMLNAVKEFFENTKTQGGKQIAGNTQGIQAIMDFLGIDINEILGIGRR